MYEIRYILKSERLKRRGRNFRALGWTIRPLAALASFAIACGYIANQSLADHPIDSPADGEVYSGCTFNAGALNGALVLDHPSSFPGGNIDPQYIIIFTVDGELNGQALAGGGGASTGPIVCIADTTHHVIDSTESVPVPNGDHNPGVESVDVTGNLATMVLQYENNDTDLSGSLDGVVDNRVCITSGDGVDCVLVHTLPAR